MTGTIFLGGTARSKSSVARSQVCLSGEKKSVGGQGSQAQATRAAWAWPPPHPFSGLYGRKAGVFTLSVTETRPPRSAD